MGIFSNKKNKNEIVAVFDIGAGSVGGAIVSLPKDQSKEKTPIILAQVRTDMKYKDDLDMEKFTSFMNEALYETAHKLMLLKIGRPNKIYCFLASPWYTSTTSTIHLEKKEKFTTSKKMIDTLIDAELKKVEIEYEKKYEDKKDKPKIMENIVLESLVNGYNVSNVFDKKVNTLDMMVYLSMSPESVLSSLKITIKRVFPHTNIYSSSFMIALYNATRLKYPNLDSYLLIDVNAEITDVGMVTEGLLVSFFSFPIGRSYILRKIMKKRNIKRQEAESILSLYASGALEENRKNEMVKIMDDIEYDWKNIFYKSIVEISKISGYTDIVHLVSHYDTSAYFASILRNPNVPLKILGDRKFSVFTLNSEDLKNLCKVNTGNCDEFLMSEALCVAYLYKL